jgi:hypothetical protein
MDIISAKEAKQISNERILYLKEIRTQLHDELLSNIMDKIEEAANLGKNVIYFELDKNFEDSWVFGNNSDGMAVEFRRLGYEIDVFNTHKSYYRSDSIYKKIIRIYWGRANE